MFVALAVVLVLMVGSSIEAFGQTCEWPQEEADSYIIIDGEVYEYLDIETSKERLKAVQQRDTLKEENRLLEDKLQLKDEKLALKEDEIAILNDASEMDQELIDKLFANGFHEPKNVPLFQRPVFTYVLGVVSTGGLFFAWKYAEGLPKEM